MTRIRFKGFSPNRLSQTGLLAESGHPSDVGETKWIAGSLSSRRAQSVPPLNNRKKNGERLLREGADGLSDGVRDAAWRHHTPNTPETTIMVLARQRHWI